MSKKTSLIILMMLLTISTIFCAEYKIIQKSEDGKYYLDEQSVVLLANYISKLEDLNANYKLQIANLEEQVKNLKELLALEQTKNAHLEEQLKELAKQLKELQARATLWTVVAAIAVGSVVLLFVK